MKVPSVFSASAPLRRHEITRPPNTRPVQLTLLVLSVACSGAPPRDQTARQAQTSAAAEDHSRLTGRDSVLKVLSGYGNSFDRGRVGITARLGSPVSRRAFDAKKSSYRYHPVVPLSGADSLIVMDYPNASFEVTPPNSDAPEEVLWTVRIWGVLPDLPRVVVPGQTTRSDVLALLGEPDAPVFVRPPGPDTTALSYESPFGPFTELISFLLVRDTVRVIRWQFRVG